MALEITSVGDELIHFCYHSQLWIWGKTLGITSLSITLNMRTVNVILIISESVFDKSGYEEMSEIRVRWISPSDETQKKNLQGRGGQKVYNNNKYRIYSNKRPTSNWRPSYRQRKLISAQPRISKSHWIVVNIYRHRTNDLLKESSEK